MRNNKLYNEARSIKPSVGSFIAIYIRTCLDMLRAFLEKVIDMIEGKTLLVFLGILCVPACIYTWFTNLNLVFMHFNFLDISTWADPVKTLLLAVVAIGSGFFFLIRSGIKTMYAWWEFRDKFKARYGKKNKI